MFLQIAQNVVVYVMVDQAPLLCQIIMLGNKMIIILHLIQSEDCLTNIYSLFALLDSSVQIFVDLSLKIDLDRGLETETDLSKHMYILWFNNVFSSKKLKSLDLSTAYLIKI